MGQPKRSEDVREDRGGTPPEDPPRKLFAAFVQEQREGALHTELTEGLAEVVQRVVDLNKPGSLSVTFKVSPAGKGQATVLVTDDVKVKPPEDKQSSLFFTDGRGNISRKNPYQGELPLREVPQEEPRDLPPRS